MGADLNIHGQKLLKTIQKEFTTQYPYLGLMFFNKEQADKGKKDGGSIKPLSSNQRLADVRVKKGDSGTEFHIGNRTRIGNLERYFEEKFGLYVQVCFFKDGKGFYTSGDADKQSVKGFNDRICKETGVEEFDYTKFQ